MRHDAIRTFCQATILEELVSNPLPARVTFTHRPTLVCMAGRRSAPVKADASRRTKRTQCGRFSDNPDNRGVRFRVSGLSVRIVRFGRVDRISLVVKILSPLFFGQLLGRVVEYVLDDTRHIRPDLGVVKVGHFFGEIPLQIPEQFLSFGIGK